MFGLGGGIDPKKMGAMMKQLGMSQKEIPAEKVIIEKTDGSKIVIENPSVAKISFHGNESFQVSGDVREESEKFTISEEDIKTVMAQANVSHAEAKAALEETRDIAEAIMKLS